MNQHPKAISLPRADDPLFTAIKATGDAGLNVPMGADNPVPITVFHGVATSHGVAATIGDIDPGFSVVAEQVESAMTTAALDHERHIEQRDLREADAIWVVWRAKAHDGRADQPPSSHDAAVTRAIAALLHTVAGNHVGKPVAQGAAPSKRVLDPRIEAGISEQSS